MKRFSPLSIMLHILQYKKVKEVNLLSDTDMFDLALLEPEGLAKSFTELKRRVFELENELVAEKEARIQTDIDMLQAAKDYTDQIFGGV